MQIILHLVHRTNIIYGYQKVIHGFFLKHLRGTHEREAWEQHWKTAETYMTVACMQ